ncbi:MAG: hypothetical protein AAF738_02270 [Bacteroidota bacterium]
MNVSKEEKSNSRPVLVSTLSTAVAMGIAYLFYNRTPKLQSVKRTYQNPLSARKRKEIYRDDSDVGYC